MRYEADVFKEKEEIKVSNGDIKEITKLLAFTPNNGESFENDTYLNEVVEKPWGYEYRIYCDSMFDAWCLHIRTGHKTSMHCHLQKDTVLLCLSGRGETKFLNNKREVVNAGESVYLNKGVFHQTFSTGDEDLILIEIENPRDKLDLLRYKDSYDRQSKAYEKESKKLDNFNELVKISPGVCLRRNDLSNHFEFGTTILTTDAAHLDNYFFIVSIDIADHMNSHIRRINAIKESANAFIGKKVLYIKNK